MRLLPIFQHGKTEHFLKLSSCSIKIRCPCQEVVEVWASIEPVAVVLLRTHLEASIIAFAIDGEFTTVVPPNEYSNVSGGSGVWVWVHRFQSTFR